MHFRNQAEAKRYGLSSLQNHALEFICHCFASSLDNIINSSTTKKLGENCYLYTVGSRFDPQVANFRIVFARDPYTGYQIDNFDFMGVFELIAHIQ